MASYEIVALDDPFAESELGSDAYALNNSGMVVGVGYAGHSGRAVFWNPSPTVIPVGDVYSLALGVNDLGHVVGIHNFDQTNVAPGGAYFFRAGIVHDLTSVLHGPGGVANDINNGGVIAAWGGPPGALHAIVYDTTSDTATDLGVLPGYTQSAAVAINNAGQVVGNLMSESASDTRAFLFDGALKDLGPATAACDINDSGQVVGSRRINGSPNWTAYLCETSGGSAQFVDLGTLSTSFLESRAASINNDGDIVGSSLTAWGNGQVHAIICRAGGNMLDLNNLIPSNSGWELHWANAINAKGQIVGLGTYNGKLLGYLLKPKRSRSNVFGRATVDPIALILTGRWYQIWTEMHHPHEPIPPDLAAVMRLMPAAERRATLERARRLGDFAKHIETMIARIMNVK
jgi:probable HAF family extracellular repeat protein